MAALLDRITAAGVQLEPAGDKLRASGPLTDELRDLIRAHKAEILAELAAANDEFCNQYARARESRRARALAMLADDPERRIAIVAEPGDPAYVTVAVCAVAIGEIEIAADRYDAFALMALMDQHGNA
jgi:hypothetical protein